MREIATFDVYSCMDARIMLGQRLISIRDCRFNVGFSFKVLITVLDFSMHHSTDTVSQILIQNMH